MAGVDVGQEMAEVRKTTRIVHEILFVFIIFITVDG
jgi:hypothetical protein